MPFFYKSLGSFFYLRWFVELFRLRVHGTRCDLQTPLTWIFLNRVHAVEVSVQLSEYSRFAAASVTKTWFIR